MGIRTVNNEHWDVLTDLFENANQKVSIISPFISDCPARLLANALNNNPAMLCSVITRFYREDFISGASRLTALRLLVEAGAKILAVKDLHAKLYLIDNDIALLGSANFTTGGFISNVELSLIIDNEPTVLSELNSYFKTKVDEINSLGDFYVTLDIIDSEERQIHAIRKTHVIEQLKVSHRKHRFGAELQMQNTSGIRDDNTPDSIQSILEKNPNLKNGRTITPYMIETVYSVYKDVFSGAITYSRGKELVAQQSGMDIGSAGNYFQSLRAMFKGDVYTRSINKMATQYFLEHIESDYGVDALRLAVESVQKHTEYFASHNKGSLSGIEKLANEFLTRFEH